MATLERLGVQGLRDTVIAYRDALKAQPANASAQSGLFEGLRTKVALLQQTVELINEMRKGNQAEAGRRFQTLSQ